MIPMTAVESSNIAEIGHDGTTLAVKFKNGATYHYSDVPPQVHADFLKSESKGVFLRTAVIGKYPYKKVA